MVVGGNKPVALQRRVAAHVQGGEPVEVDVQELELFQHGTVKFLQPIVEGLDKGKFRIVAHIQRLQIIVPAIQLHQRRVAGQIQCLQPVVLAVQFHQLRAAGHVQAGESVVGAVQKAQSGIAAHVQAGERVVLHRERLQGGKVLDARQVRDAEPGQPQVGDGAQFGSGEEAVGSRAPQVVLVQQPGAQRRVREIGLVDGHCIIGGQDARRRHEGDGQRGREYTAKDSVCDSHGGFSLYMYTVSLSKKPASGHGIPILGRERLRAPEMPGGSRRSRCRRPLYHIFRVCPPV